MSHGVDTSFPLWYHSYLSVIAPALEENPYIHITISQKCLTFSSEVAPNWLLATSFHRTTNRSSVFLLYRPCNQHAISPSLPATEIHRPAFQSAKLLSSLDPRWRQYLPIKIHLPLRELFFRNYLLFQFLSFSLLSYPPFYPFTTLRTPTALVCLGVHLQCLHSIDQTAMGSEHSRFKPLKFLHCIVNYLKINLTKWSLKIYNIRHLQNLFHFRMPSPASLSQGPSLFPWPVQSKDQCIIARYVVCTNHWNLLRKHSRLVNRPRHKHEYHLKGAVGISFQNSI